jgi:hypothetical protein
MIFASEKNTTCSSIEYLQDIWKISKAIDTVSSLASPRSRPRSNQSWPRARRHCHFLHLDRLVQLFLQPFLHGIRDCLLDRLGTLREIDIHAREGGAAACRCGRLGKCLTSDGASQGCWIYGTRGNGDARLGNGMRKGGFHHDGICDQWADVCVRCCLFDSREMR